jgi:hypothetical protein
MPVAWTFRGELLAMMEAAFTDEAEAAAWLERGRLA